MVISKKKHSGKTPGKQGSENTAREPNKINASTPFDFTGKNLIPYGGPPASRRHEQGSTGTCTTSARALSIRGRCCGSGKFYPKRNCPSFQGVRA